MLVITRSVSTMQSSAAAIKATALDRSNHAIAFLPLQEAKQKIETASVDRIFKLYALPSKTRSSILFQLNTMFTAPLLLLTIMFGIVSA